MYYLASMLPTNIFPNTKTPTLFKIFQISIPRHMSKGKLFQRFFNVHNDYADHCVFRFFSLII